MKQTDQALFNDAEMLAVDGRLVEELKARARSSPTRRFRLCLHHSPQEPTQEMIIVHCRDNYSRPHAHRLPLTYVIIDGAMRVLFFDSGGEVQRSVDLGAFGGARPFALHIRPGLWYMPACLTPEVVFYETRWGPFRRDSILWAPWSPAEDDTAEIAAYRRLLGIDFDES